MEQLDQTTSRKSAGICVAAVICVAGCLSMRSRFECTHFTVEMQTICSNKIKAPKTLVFLTDLHDNAFGRDNVVLLDAIRAQKPDAILIGGDTMIAKRGTVNLNQTANLLEQLVKIAPVCYAYGNHESRLKWDKKRYGTASATLEQILQKNKVYLLRNRSAMLSKDLCVTGLELEKRYYQMCHPEHLTAEAITNKVGEAQKDGFQILLAHTPIFAQEYLRWGADLTLCGHFHGGVVRVPGIGGIVTPQERLVHPFAEGRFSRGNQHVLVGRGLGTHTLNVRLNNRAQLVVVQLNPQQRT